jgi:hypothetical protein
MPGPGRLPPPGPAAGPDEDPGAASPDAAQPKATGYSIVIPPEWRKIPVRGDADEAVRAIVAEVFAAIPRTVPPDRIGPYRRELRSQLDRMVAEARKKGALDLYLPVMPMHGAPVGASFAVSELPMNAPDPAMIVAHLAAEDDAVQPMTVDGALGLRIGRTASAAPADGVEFGSRRVDYVLNVPGDPQRWLVIAFSTVGGGDPGDGIADLLAALFDAMMSTFSWQREQP